jgi:glucose-1-phosphate cytidylyltransferase
MLMKVVILAGGLGTRLSEETSIRPKPMVEIGGRPILWHVMKTYSAHGLNEFVILGGYKVEFIRSYLLNYRQNVSNFTIDLESGDISFHDMKVEPWRVTILDTGLDTMTGGRVKRARDVIGNETFCLTYGDGVTDVDIKKVIDFHRKTGAWVTVTAVAPPGRYGVLRFSDDSPIVRGFREKDYNDVGLINGGYFVCEPAVFELIEDDATVWERGPMERLVEMGKLVAYHHRGYWQSMDTLHDKALLEETWASGTAPWAVWER